MTVVAGTRYAGTSLATALGGYVFFGGFISFLGWPLDLPRLTDWFGDDVSIQPNACLLLMISGAAVWLVQQRAWRAVGALGALVGLGGGLILLQYVVGADFGFNHQLLFGRTWGQGTTLTPGRVGPPASSSFALTGIALLLLAAVGVQPRRAPLRRVVPILGLAVCITMSFSLLGYLFGAEQFYTIPWLTAIALQTATMLLAVGVGLVLSVPEHQPMLLLREHSGAGALARVAIPALAALIPLVLWLRVKGFELGYYDLGSGLALGALTLVVATVTILWISLIALRRYEEALRDREARYRTLFQVAAHGIITIDQQGLIESVNPAAQKLFGYSSSELVGRNITLLLPESYRSEQGAFLNSDLLTGQSEVTGVARELVGQRKDGSTFPMELTMSEFQLRQRRYFKGFVVDISQRKQAEQALRDSETRLRAIIEQLPTGVGVMDTAGAWTLTNSLMELYVPGSIPSTLPDPLAHWQGWDDQGNPVPPEQWPGKRALRGETVMPGLQMLYTGDGGCRRWMRVSAAPLRDGAGEIVGATCVAQDVTHVKAAQDALRERAEELEKLMDVMPVAVWIARDAACRQITGNRAGYELLRVPIGENLSKSPPEGERVPGFRVVRDGIEVPADQLVMQYAAAHGVEVRGYEEDIVFDDGTVIRAYGAASPLYDEQGQVRGCVAAFMDVTELRRLEKELQQTINELAAADRRKDEFLATLAHELRNPLAPQMNALDILEYCSDEATAGEVRATMRRQMKQMVRLIDDLLDVSRISHGTIELRRERVQLQSVVDHAIESVHPTCEAARQELIVDLPPLPVWIDADPVRLSQIIVNLLTNASRYSEPGTSIRLQAGCEGGEITLRVTDRGIGIPPENLESIFEMFSQVDRSLERTAGGLGIGLYLVRRLVEMHGGTVVAYSDGPGRGSTIVVRLPVVAQPPSLIESEAATELDVTTSSGRRPNVLVVDDNRDAADTMVLLLEAHGLVAQAAHDGLQAVEAAQRSHPDVILMDIGLPELNGYDACQRIRRQPRGSEMVIIALTGWGQEQDKHRAEESGFDAHFVKPVEAPELLERLAALLKQRNPSLGSIALNPDSGNG